MRRPAVVWIASLSALVLAGCDAPEATVQDVPAPTDVVVLSEAQVQAAGLVTRVVDAQSLRPTARVSGVIQSPDTARASVGSFVEGRVTQVHVLPGDRVEPGQALVEIHTHELADAVRDLSAAQAEERYHETALSRAEELLTAGAVSTQDVERRRADYEAAMADRVRAEDIVDHLNPSPHGHSIVIAPRRGTVFSVAARSGQAVVPGTPLLEMGATDVLWAVAYVPEYAAGDLAVGDRVDVHFDSPTAVVSARLVLTGNFVDADTRAVEVRFELDSIPPGVRPGSFATVQLPTSVTITGVRLKADAALRLGDDEVVFVVDGEGRYRAVVVQTAPAGGGELIVTGLPDGSEVVVVGAYFLKAALELAADAPPA